MTWCPANIKSYSGKCKDFTALKLFGGFQILSHTLAALINLNILYNMEKSFFAGILAFCLFFTSGCASIVSKSNYPVSIDSEPNGASVSILDKKDVEIFKGRTPAALKLKAGDGYFSKSAYRIKISKEGYEEQIIPVQFKLNAWYFGNILLGGVIGLLIVDPLTGAMWKIEKDEYLASLDQKGKGKPVAGAALHIKLLEQVSPAERQAMVRVR
jgi:hypothetical protein